jgi:DNA modification methylase
LKKPTNEKNQSVSEAFKGKKAMTYKLIQADIKDLCDIIGKGTVDAIITDPPYGEKYLDLYEDLAWFGAHALKQGRPLLTMAPQRYLPDILDRMRGSLDYHWMDCNLTGHSWPRGPLFHDKVMSQWKPIIWFTNGEYQGDYVPDLYKMAVTKTDKKLHKWGQNEAVFSKLVEDHTKPGDLVCDPFCGCGILAGPVSGWLVTSLALMSIRRLSRLANAR